MEKTEAQELIDNLPRSGKIKKYNHVAIRPPTMGRWRASRLRKGGIKSDDAFANLLLDEHEALEAQKE